MNNILIIGGGDIADNGIIPLLGGRSLNKKDCDVRDYKSIEKQIVDFKPQTVICTAGVSHVSDIKNSSIQDIKEELDINLLGSFHVAKACAYHGVNNMIFFASVAGLYGKPEHSGYSASKSGVISLVQSLGMEGYNAYAISAGRVHTKMRERDFPNEDPRTRLLPESIGKVVKEILDNKYTKGSNIIIRKRGYRILRRVDKGSGWAEYLNVGQPPVF
jgi:NAD(P)-dependent dehydrogenase (short-subunit alcohol dehydrogenase family)